MAILSSEQGGRSFMERGYCYETKIVQWCDYPFPDITISCLDVWPFVIGHCLEKLHIQTHTRFLFSYRFAFSSTMST